MELQDSASTYQTSYSSSKRVSASYLIELDFILLSRCTVGRCTKYKSYGQMSEEVRTVACSRLWKGAKDLGVVTNAPLMGPKSKGKM